MPQLLSGLRQETHLSLGGRDCSKLRSWHCTPAWVTQSETLSQKRNRNKQTNKKTKKTLCFMHTVIKNVVGWVQGLTPVILALWAARVEGSRGQEFKTSLANVVKHHLY